MTIVDVTILTGAISQCAPIPLIDDNALEYNENFTVILSSEDGGVILNNAIISVTIIDNDGK